MIDYTSLVEDLKLNDNNKVVAIVTDKIGSEYTRYAPYRWNAKQNAFVNCSGSYHKKYFMQLLRAEKIVLR